ncbi:acetyl-CoA synthetase (ADP-forming) alpha subunit / branched-chain acyl-CoA synthetase (ADP-forming) alpha subunit [Staphylothermus marinus F1]|uniref:Acetyl-CoA synthetase (ADP-forming) alpha subunit / branched-chain acyl-CoA synthetase (ADP-forming) alpha subunit n=1 Tax=Staphylothermus marinus (strain ATCC 43588 / DSM 3639 / JCM 9404 / F1) TaxID=399550 RepID=A3DLQ0_STAMF|nr:CoA-binding protein [Staphylothermus marinus]ABN69560.1 acetyl-CoA synthetase (ADP-forming) alpha subunit / branched-chain acyl-CoA synthetase (ADP-forming) alpha subunit [Staphylothermus marinus F1]
MAIDNSLKPLFEPRSIAIIGASRSPGKIGHTIMKNIIEYGYKGKIYPINPKADEILGYKAYKSVVEVPDEIDMAIIVVPEQVVPKVAEECGKKGVKVLVVITSGFSEVGNVEAERKLVEIARRYGMRILGPNIFGIAYTPAKLNATFGPKDVLEGPIAFITQSGALGIALMGWTIMEEIGISALVSMGNMADIDVIDVSKYLANDPNTKVITIYLEGLKPGTGRKFIEEMKKVTVKKPVIVIKAGRSKRGAAAAASHTGSLAGSDNLYQAAFKQAGIIRAYTTEEMFDWARAFASQPIPRGEETIIITNGGGVGVLATDAAEEHNVKLLDPSPELKEKFKKTMPWFGSAKNPIDLTGQAVVENYVEALRTAFESDEIHNIILLYCRTAILDPRDLANAIVKLYGEYKGTAHSKPLVAGFVGGEDVREAIRLLNKNGIPAYPSAERAVASIAKMIWYMRYLNKIKSRK